MNVSRLFVDAPVTAGETLSLTGEPAHYLGRVLRARAGDELVIFDGSGHEFPARVIAVARQRVDLAIEAGREVDRESRLELWLAQGLSRGERMDVVVQKATELGVRRILPMACEFSVLRLDGERAAKRAMHWRRIAASACEQCGRNRLPEVMSPAGFDATLEATAGEHVQRLILAPGASESLRELPRPAGPVLLMIGPEGGFSAAEQQRALDAGAIAVGLGPRVLRTETAAIAVAALLQGLWGDLAPRRGDA